MKKALVVGIDYYTDISALYGCVNDAHSVKNVLERHADGSVNFAVKLLTGSSENDQVTKVDLKSCAKELFQDDCEIALFYFAGHGYVESVGGFLCTSECKTGDDGLSLHELSVMANLSKAKNKIIILDSCYSGIAGNRPALIPVAELSEGLTVLTAATETQYAQEKDGTGVFTSLLVDALSGSAANLVGDVTPGGVYAHIDQSLGPWEQRPVFKTNVKNFVSIRKALPPIALEHLLQLSKFFPESGYVFKLDPSFEPEGPNPNPDNTQIFSILQKYNRVNLVVPFDAPHMYHAAMDGKGCKLTVLGEHYRRLVASGRI